MRCLHSVSPVAAVALGVGSCFGGPDVNTASDPNPYSVVRPESVAPFFASARLRRVDMAIVSDSNTRSAGVSGYEDGMGRAFWARYGCYATRVDPVGGVGGWSAEIGLSYCGQTESITSGAPADLLANSLRQEVGFPYSFAYLPAGTSLAMTNNTGLGIGATHPLNISGPLRWHMTHFLFPRQLQVASQRPPHASPPPEEVEPGKFSPTCRERWPGSAWNNYAEAEVETSNGVVVGFTDWSMDVPAGVRSEYGVLFSLTNLVTGEDGAARGPFFAQWNRVENTSTLAGLAYSPLLYQGGQTTRDAAISLVMRSTQPQMTEWFRQVTRLQNGEPMLLIQIIQGANDANTDVPAFVYNRGDAPRALDAWLTGAPTNEHAGIKQNFTSVINRLRDYWAAAGYEEENLYFLIGSYHPHTASWNESVLGANDGLQYHVIREEAIPAWREICAENSNISMVNGFLLSSPEEFLANGWYRYNSNPYIDHAHLSIPGFHAWGDAVAEAVTRACDCGPSVDIDLNGAREVADIFGFLSLWFAGDPRANFDRAGATPTVPDIFAFLSSWFAGCAGH